MPQDKVKEVYGLISDLGYFKDENEFKSYVSDPKKRKEAFDLIADEGYFKDENEFNSYFTEVKPTEPPIQKTGTYEPRNKVAEMLNQPTSQDIQREKRGISEVPKEVPSGTKTPQIGVPVETAKKQVETEQKQKVKRQEESAFIGVQQDQKAKNLDPNQYFTEKSDNIANYLNEESKVEYNFLKALETYGREVDELTVRTEATGNPQTQADLQKAKFNKYKAQVELEKFTKQRNAKIDEQINFLSNTVQQLQQEGDREEEIAGLQKDIVKLQSEKENYLQNPDQKIMSVFSANKQEMDEFKVPGNTPRERVKNYALIVNRQIEEIDEKIKTNFPGEPLEEPSWTGGYKMATRSPELEDLWRRKMELIPKMQALAQVALVDRLPQKDTGGLFGAMTDQLKKELLPDKFTQQNLKDMDIQDVGALIQQNQIAMGLADEMVNQSALKETQRQQAPTEAFSSEWFGSILGNSLAMGPAYTLGAGASLAANVPKFVRAAKIASTSTKYGKFLVPTLKATERGVEYAMAKPFLQQESLKDEATFMSGFLGAAIAKPIEKTLSAKNMQAVIGKLFGDKAPMVANKIMQLGNRVASGLGEYGEEVGNTVGSIVGDYLETKDFAELKKSLNDQFGSLEPNMELFVGSVVMGFFMGSGTGIGDAAINKSKEIYAAMTPNQQKTADEILKQFKNDLETSEVNAKRQEIAEGETAPKVEEVTEVDLQNKQAAIEVIQSPTASIKEKAEAAKVVRDIEAKEREVAITEKALEQGPLEEGEIVKEEVVETPKEEAGELTFEKAKEGDEIIHNGKKVRVVSGATKSMAGWDIIQVESEESGQKTTYSITKDQWDKEVSQTPKEEVVAEEVVSETPTNADAKKADIERRRQEDLSKNKVEYSGINLKSEAIEVSIAARPTGGFAVIVSLPSKTNTGFLNSTALTQEFETRQEAIDYVNETIKPIAEQKINAKYDAELKALKTSPTNQETPILKEEAKIDNKIEETPQKVEEGKVAKTNNINGYEFTNTPSLKDVIVKTVPQENLVTIESDIFLTENKKSLAEGVKNEGGGWYSMKQNAGAEVFLYNDITKEGVVLTEKKGGTMGIVVQDFINNNSREATTPIQNTPSQTSLSEQKSETKVETPKDTDTKVKELTEKRDVELFKASKPSLKLDWVSVKEIAQLPSEISKTKKEQQAAIKTKYKELLKIMDCL